ncbi:MAG: SpoIIE family protein phosphatase [Cyanobacteria bacterium P01_H01_bin.15]
MSASKPESNKKPPSSDALSVSNDKQPLSSKFSLLGSLPIRVVLIAPFVLQTLAAVGLVGYFSFRNGNEAVDDVATQLSQEIISRIEGQTKSLMVAAHNLNQVNANTLQSGLLNLEDTAQLQYYFWQQLQAFEVVGATYFTNPQGRFLGAERLAGGALLMLESSPTEAVLRGYLTNQIGQKGNQIYDKPGYDAQAQPGYDTAQQAEQPTWSEIYTDFKNNQLVITATQPVYDAENNALIGIVGSDFLFLHIHRFFQELQVGYTGLAFIVEPNGELVTASTSAPFFTKDQGVSRQINAVESKDETIQQLATIIEANLGFENIDNVFSSKIKLGQEPYYTRIAPLQDEHGLNWVLVVAFPESDFMSRIYANTRRTIVLCILTLIISVLTGLLLVRWICRPILHLCTAAEELSHKNLDKRVILNRRDEVGQLALSFNRMADHLQDSFETLEEKVKERTAKLASANNQITALNEQLKAENLRMGAELDIARQIQQMVLPREKELKNISGLEIAGFMEPADEVGGDYYDVLETDNVVTLTIGDVTGHGLESGLVMLMTQTAVRTLNEIREYDPIRFLDTLNRTIYQNVQRMESEKNLTLAVLNYAAGQMIISGQHEETLIVRANGMVERVDTVDLGFPIGLDDDIREFISHVAVEISPGDGIVLYTDGITEACNENHEQYGIERLCEIISQNWHDSAETIKSAIVTDLRRFIGNQKVFDDITLLVLKRELSLSPAAEHPVVQS